MTILRRDRPLLRRTKHRGQIAIQVDLNRALNDRRENILLQAGDVLIVQESVGEAITPYITTVFHYDFLGTIIRRRDLTATTDLTGP
jgi:hypothetical protein